MNNESTSKSSHVDALSIGSRSDVNMRRIQVFGAAEVEDIQGGGNAEKIFILSLLRPSWPPGCVPASLYSPSKCFRAQQQTQSAAKNGRFDPPPPPRAASPSQAEVGTRESRRAGRERESLVNDSELARKKCFRRFDRLALSPHSGCAL